MTTTCPATTPPQETFTRMDEATAEQWAVIVTETMANQGRVADNVLAMLRSLADITDGFAVDQLTHSLADRDPRRARRRRRRAGGRVALPRHRQGGERAEPPAHRGRDPAAVRARRGALGDRGAPGLPGPHYYHHLGGDPNARDKHRDHPSYEFVARFADEWDQIAFDPDYDTLPLEHFEDRVRAQFAKANLI